MNDIILAGCTPTPLANYLKALGVLRLLSEQKTELSYQGLWRNGTFVLRSPSFTGQEECDRKTISEFFLEKYQPSALVTPWNGRGGFLEGDEEDVESSRAGAQMVRTFSGGTVATRFHPLAGTLKSIAGVNVVELLNSARAELKRLKADEKAKGKKNLSDAEKEAISQQDALVKVIKGKLLQELRNSLPDDALSWFDACLALVNDQSSARKKAAPSPLLGAGGLDGSMDFGVNYLKRLNDIFDPVTGLPRNEAKEWLDAALFGTVTDKLFSKSPQDKKKVSVGQFSPSNAGGYNADSGFTGEALLNPWDTILQLEGAVLFAASTVRRLEGRGDIYASLPFTVAPTAIGDAITLSDESPKGAKRRTAETWLPLWSRPATHHELEAIFQEGRITLRGRQVSNGFDCVRALTSLGTSRGIGSFQRFTFLKRSGDAFFALDSGRFDVRESVYGSLINELDGHRHFLATLHSFVRSKTNSGEWKASGKLRAATIQLDHLCVRVLRKDDQLALLELLELLGEIQRLIAQNTVARKTVPPVPRLSVAWVTSAEKAIATHGNASAFRIAKALAGLRGVGEAPLPLHAQLFPVHPRSNVWMEDARKAKNANNDPACQVRIHTGQSGRLADTLCALLQRRLWLAERLDMRDKEGRHDKPLASPAGVTLDDMAAFLRDDHMDSRIAALLPGLALCTIPEDTDKSASDGAVPAAFALLKLALTPDRILRSLKLRNNTQRLLPQFAHMPIPVGMVPRLGSGNNQQARQAVQTAWRRLRASGLAPLFDAKNLPSLSGIHSQRAAAALLIPMRYGATGALVHQTLRTTERKTESTDNPQGEPA